MVQVKSAEFVFGAQVLDGLPDPSLPEIALVGRSNVGKSSFVNRLTRQKKLARVSDTPGRTQQLNFFKVKLHDPTSGTQDIFLVDLPGFGFAKLDKDRREELSEIVVHYIRTQSSLRIVCLLNDCRRLPGVDELAIRDLAYESDKHFLVVLTKTDKLSKNEIVKQSKVIANAYGLQPSDLVVTHEKDFGEGLWNRALPLFGLDEE